MSPELVCILACGAGLLSVCAVYAAFQEELGGKQKRISQRIEDECRLNAEGRPRRSPLFKSLESDHHRLNLVARLQQWIRHAGVDISVEVMLGVCLSVGFVGAGASGVLLPSSWSTIVGAAAGFCLPLLAIRSWARRRQACFAGQLPEALELMSRAVRGGHTVPMALELVSLQMPSPIADEFGEYCEQKRLGLPDDVALLELVERNTSIDLQIFATAMIVQRQTGGNIVEMFDAIALRIRKRARLRQRVLALTSEGRLQAIVLMTLPVAALALIGVLNRPYAQVLFDRPQLLAGLALAQVVGGLWIRHIVNLAD